MRRLTVQKSLFSPVLSSMRIVERVDNNPMRKKVFADIAQRHVIVRSVYQLYTITRRTFLAPLMIMAYGVKCFVSLKPACCESASIVSNPVHPSELHAIGTIEQWVGKEIFGRLVTKRSHTLHLPNWRLLLGYGKSLPALYRIARYLVHRYEFMPACRINAALWYYLYTLRFLLDHPNIHAIFTASIASPEATGFIAAAKKTGKKIIYTNHSVYTVHKDTIPTPLSADLAILTGEQMADTFRRIGTLPQHLVFKGINGKGKPIILPPLAHTGYSVGIFLTAVTRVDTFEDLLKNLYEKHCVKKVLVRLHPNKLFGDACKMTKKYKNIFPDLLFSQENPIEEDLEHIDFAICGNSSAVLEILYAGVPVLYYGELDEIPDDYIGFIANGLIPRLAEPGALNIREIHNFYEDNWKPRMCYYNASYGMEEHVIREDIKQAVMTLISPTRPVPAVPGNQA